MCFKSYKIFYTGLGHFKPKRISKLNHWFKSYRNFAECVDFAYYWYCIGKGLRAACKTVLFIISVYIFISILLLSNWILGFVSTLVLDWSCPIFLSDYKWPDSSPITQTSDQKTLKYNQPSPCINLSVSPNFPQTQK